MVCKAVVVGDTYLPFPGHLNKSRVFRECCSVEIGENWKYVPSLIKLIQATAHEVFMLVSSVKQGQMATVLNVNESFVEPVSHGAPPES
jgi:hypothetical protein